MILDASVAAKWFLKREKYGSDAIRLRQDYEAGKVDLSAPSLILYEDCSAIRKIKDIAREKASKLAEAASTYLGNIVLSPHPQSYRRVLSNARTWDVSVCDSSYATISEEQGTPLITADDYLRKRLSSTSIPVILT